MINNEIHILSLSTSFEGFYCLATARLVYYWQDIAPKLH